MGKSAVLNDTPKRLSCAAGDVFIQGRYFLAINGNSAPGANYDAWMVIDQPIVLPKGTIAYLKAYIGGSTVTASVLGESGAPTDPWA